MTREQYSKAARAVWDAFQRGEIDKERARRLIVSLARSMAVISADLSDCEWPVDPLKRNDRPA